MSTEMKGLNARQMTLGDLDQVLKIEQGSYGVPWSRNMFIEEISSSVGRQLVFHLEKNIVGYVCYWDVIDECHVLNIAVHPNYRRRGIATAILRILEVACRAQHITRILLDVGRQNHVARALYKKCGFKTVGFRKNYYTELGDDALLMDKILEETNERPSP